MSSKEIGTYRLATGREVFVRGLHIDFTYAGLIEGRPETASWGVLQDMAKHAQRVLPPGNPFVLVMPPTVLRLSDSERSDLMEEWPRASQVSVLLPSYCLIAELESRKGVKTKDPDYHSTLFVGWFADDFASDLDALIDSAVHGIDWDNNAEDYDITFI